MRPGNAEADTQVHGARHAEADTVHEARHAEVDTYTSQRGQTC